MVTCDRVRAFAPDGSLRFEVFTLETSPGCDALPMLERAFQYHPILDAEGRLYVAGSGGVLEISDALAP